MVIYKRDILYIIALMGICAPLGISGTAPYSTIFTLIKAACLLYAVLLVLSKRLELDRFVIAWFVYFGVVFISVLINSGDVSTFVSKYYPVFALIVIVQDLYKEEPEHLFEITSKFLVCILVLNSLLGVISQTTLMSDADVYLLGIRTRVNDLGYVAIVMAMISSVRNKKNIKWVIAAIIAFIYFIIKEEVSTAYVCSVVLIILCVLAYRFPGGFAKQSKLIFWGIIVINIVIVAGGILTSLDWFFEGILGESSDLTGRTEIWASVLSQMPGNWLLGHGLGTERSFLVVTNYTTATHSQLLNELYNGGILEVLAFLNIFYTFVKKCIEKSKFAFSLALVGIFVCQVAMISEILCDHNYLYLFIMSTYFLIANDGDFGLTKYDVKELEEENYV